MNILSYIPNYTMGLGLFLVALFLGECVIRPICWFMRRVVLNNDSSKDFFVRRAVLTSLPFVIRLCVILISMTVVLPVLGNDVLLPGEYLARTLLMKPQVLFSMATVAFCIHLILPKLSNRSFSRALARERRREIKYRLKKAPEQKLNAIWKIINDSDTNKT